MKIVSTMFVLSLFLPRVASAQTLDDANKAWPSLRTSAEIVPTPSAAPAYPRAAMGVFHPSQYQIAKKAYEASQAPATIDDVARDFQCVYAMPPSAVAARMDETAHVAMEPYAVGTRTVIDVSYMCYQVDCARTTISNSGADLVEQFMNGQDAILRTSFRKSGDRVTFRMSYLGTYWGDRDGKSFDYYGDCR